LNVDVLIANGPQRLQTICTQPNHVIVKLHQIGRCCSIFSKNGLQVLKGLLCLRIEIIFRDMAAFIGADLARKEDEPPSRNNRRLTITWGMAPVPKSCGTGQERRSSLARKQTTKA